MLQREPETEDGTIPEITTLTIKNSIHNTPLEVPEEETPASDWIILDIIGIIDNAVFFFLNFKKKVKSLIINLETKHSY